MYRYIVKNWVFPFLEMQSFNIQNNLEFLQVLHIFLRGTVAAKTEIISLVVLIISGRSQKTCWDITANLVPYFR